MPDIARHPAHEGIWSRARGDSCASLRKHWFTLWDAFGAGLGGSAIGALIPDWWHTPVLYSHAWDWTVGWQVVAGALATALIFASPILIVLNWHLARAPFRQRNEARESLFPTGELELSIKRTEAAYVGPTAHAKGALIQTGDVVITNQTDSPMVLDVMLRVPVPKEIKFLGDMLWMKPTTEPLPIDPGNPLSDALGDVLTVQGKNFVRGRWVFFDDLLVQFVENAGLHRRELFRDQGPIELFVTDLISRKKMTFRVL